MCKNIRIIKIMFFKNKFEMKKKNINEDVNVDKELRN
jgi:hypothetical protein